MAVLRCDEKGKEKSLSGDWEGRNCSRIRGRGREEKAHSIETFSICAFLPRAVVCTASDGGSGTGYDVVRSKATSCNEATTLVGI